MDRIDILWANMFLINILLGYFVAKNRSLSKKIAKIEITVDFLYHKLAEKNDG